MSALPAELPVSTRTRRLERICGYLRGRGWVPIVELSSWMALELGSRPSMGHHDLTQLQVTGCVERRPTRGEPGCTFRAYEYRLLGEYRAPHPRPCVAHEFTQPTPAEKQRRKILKLLGHEMGRMYSFQELHRQMPHLTKAALRARLMELERQDLIVVDREERPLLYGRLS